MLIKSELEKLRNLQQDDKVVVKLPDGTIENAHFATSFCGFICVYRNGRTSHTQGIDDDIQSVLKIGLRVSEMYTPKEILGEFNSFANRYYL